LGDKSLKEALKITLHHNNNIPIWTRAKGVKRGPGKIPKTTGYIIPPGKGTMVELPWIIHSSFSKILHRKDVHKGPEETKAHRIWAPRYWKTVAYNYDISHGTR